MLKTIFHKISKLLLIATAIFLPVSNVLADSSSDFGLGATAGATGLPKGDIQTFLGKFAGAGLALSGSIFLFLIVYGGIIMMTAAGSQEKVKKGKDIITWAIIGALVLGSAYAITSLVFGVFATTPIK
jgi:hypothetical protein